MRGPWFWHRLSPKIGVMNTSNCLRLALWIFLACCPVLAEVRVPILLFDYAGVSPSALGGAKATASRILGEAGIHAEFVDCDPVNGCQNPPGALQVRIITKEMAKLAAASKTCLGYSLVANGSGFVASAFYHRAQESERENIAGLGSILGAILAHEIGHLLLGDNKHARDGIMRPVWDRETLRSIARGRLLFTEAQAGRISTNAARRWN
jgi:hypothetical protein